MQLSITPARLRSALPLWSVTATFSLLLAALSPGMLAAPLPADEAAPQGGKRSPKPPPGDSLLLKDGKSLSGSLLDKNGDEYVFLTSEGKQFISSGEVRTVQRSLDPSFSKVFLEEEAKAKTAEDWRELAWLCMKNLAHLEERVSWRKVLLLEPDDVEAHKGLGEKFLDRRWVGEKEIELKLKEGYKIVDGKLVGKSSPADTGTKTVVKEEKTSASGEAKAKGAPKEKEKGKRTATAPGEARTIRAVDHLEKVLAEKDAHSLWMLLSRSGVRWVVMDGVGGQPDLKYCRLIIDKVSQKGKDYRAQMTKFLAGYGVPRDWGPVNEKKVEEFKKRFPKGIHLETRHYHILSTASPELTRELGQKMDIVTEQVYQKIFEFEEKIPHKYILRFWKDRNEFISQGAPPQAAAYYMPDTKELIGYNLRTSGVSLQDPFQTLFHEGWHQYFDFYIPSAPFWFNEGFAEVIYPTVIKGNKAIRNGFNPIRSTRVAQAAAKNELIPLRELIKMPYEQAYSPTQIDVGYAEAWSFVYFLTTFSSPDRKLQERVRNFYKDYFWELHKGTDFVTAVDVVFKDVKFETLEAAWIQAIPRQK
jgi:hypothetical protein